MPRSCFLKRHYQISKLQIWRNCCPGLRCRNGKPQSRHFSLHLFVHLHLCRCYISDFVMFIMLGFSVLPSPSRSDGEFAIRAPRRANLVEEFAGDTSLQRMLGEPSFKDFELFEWDMFACVGILVCHARKNNSQCWIEHEARLFSRSGGFGGDALPCWNDCHCQSVCSIDLNGL